MKGRAITTLIAVAAAIAFVCLGGVMTIAGTASTCSVVTLPTGSTSARYDTEQLHNAGIIVSVGARRGIPVRGQIIAVATAIQESGLRNLGHQGDRNDHDSLGLFQQRPSQGWGTPEQILDPVYASSKFYDKLLTIPGWEAMPLTEAAQAVQRSAYPDAYAKWETDATILVGVVGSAYACALPGDLGQCVSSDGWTQPVRGVIVSRFRTVERPGHDGVDIAATAGTPICAASSGTVTVVRCNVVPEEYGCDRDGSPDIRGCGWYVDIEHGGGVVTRYCHMLTEPLVQVGQTVVVGQVIGLVGSSGNSSGPHLHFEVRLGSSLAAVDPVDFMRQHGAALG